MFLAILAAPLRKLDWLDNWMDFVRMGVFYGSNKLYSRGVMDFSYFECGFFYYTGINLILVLVGMCDFIVISKHV